MVTLDPERLDQFEEREGQGSEFKPLIPTKAGQWKKTAIFLLPSGNVAELRSVDFTLFAKMGTFPDTLTPMIEQIFTRGDWDPGKAADELIRDKTVLELLVNERKTMEAFARVAFVNPKIVDHPQGEDEISADDLSEEDLRFVMALLSLPARELQSFSEESNKRMASLGTVQHKPEVSGGVPGNKTMGKRANRGRR